VFILIFFSLKISSHISCIPVVDEAMDDVDAEGVVLGGEDIVEEEQLADHVGDVQHLRDDKQYRQVAAHSATHANYYYDLGDIRFRSPDSDTY